MTKIIIIIRIFRCEYYTYTVQKRPTAKINLIHSRSNLLKKINVLTLSQTCEEY
jgi:hypothetical protein